MKPKINLSGSSSSFSFFNRMLKCVIGIFLCGVLLGLCTHVLADHTDVLSGTTGDVTTTINGSGKKWLYLIEGVASLFAYIKTKNVFVLGGVAVVAIMINIILHLAGASS